MLLPFRKKMQNFIVLPVMFVLLLPLLLCNNVSKNETKTKPRANDKTVDSLLNTMTLDEKIGQLFMIAAHPKQGKKDKIQVSSLIKKYKVGGVIFFKSSPTQQAKLTNYYQSLGKIPLMIGGDYEWGLSMRMDSVQKYPYQMLMGAIQNDFLIYKFGKEIARQCRRIGVHINFAPVADINNNPDNPVINYRSFGENKFRVAQKAVAYMLGLQNNKVLATGKHFPGHGDTDTDSHKNLPIIKHSSSHIDSLELFPFKELIKYGAAGMMIGHLHIPSLDSAPNIPSSISKKIINDLLIKKLKFNGLVFTDALGMQGVTQYTKPGDIEVAALRAGVDVLLMPENTPGAFSKIKQAIKSGLLSESDITKKCRKILKTKNWLGLLKDYKPVQIKHLIEDLNTPESKILSHHLIASGITVVKDAENMLPISNLQKKRAAIAIGKKKEYSFQNMLKRYEALPQFSVSAKAQTEVFNKYISQLSGYKEVIVSLHNLRNKPPNFGISPRTLEFVEKLAERTKVILVVFGNPYALQKLTKPQNIPAIVVAYNDWTITGRLTAELLYGGISARGILPVTAGVFPAGCRKTYLKNRLEYVSPEDLHLRLDSLKKIDSIVLDGITQGAYPGATVIGIRNGKVFFRKSYGYHTYAKKVHTRNTDIYDLASITKIASTLPILMQLSENKKFNVNKKLSDYLPELKNTNKRNVRIKDILAHQARLRDWIPFYLHTYSNRKKKILDKTIYSSKKSKKFSVKVAQNLYITKSYRDTMCQEIYDSKLRKHHGYKYSDLGFILFNKFIEQTTGMRQDLYASKHFYKPLGAETLGYLPLNRFPKKRIIPTESDFFFRKQLIHGYVHDYAAAMTGGVNGHAGLFANADDLAKLAQMYLNGGIYGGHHFLDSETLKKFSTKAFTGNRRALGFDKPRRPSGGPCSNYASNESYGHSGFTGTLLWIDPKYNFIYIFLSNRIHPSATNMKLIRMNIRTKIQDVFYHSFPDFK
ncbi:MAG: hypothetical protein CSB06_01565 [Bacteroidia bacterium]|nr:MAG: hypothetical protein CSB06_01565 [Bacteroidia bacterium]